VQPWLPGAGASKAPPASEAYLASLVKLHHVTFAWRGGGNDVMVTGDPAGGWTHTLTLSKPAAAAGGGEGDVEEEDDDAPHSVSCILPTGTFRFKFIVDGQWTVSPNYPIVADDGDNVNNEIFVGAASWPFEWVQVPTAAGGVAGPKPKMDIIQISQDVRVPEKELAEKEGVSGSVSAKRARKRRPAAEEALEKMVPDVAPKTRLYTPNAEANVVANASAASAAPPSPKLNPNPLQVPAAAAAAAAAASLTPPPGAPLQVLDDGDDDSFRGVRPTDPALDDSANSGGAAAATEAPPASEGGAVETRVPAAAEAVAVGKYL
jgi:hypothetical protein